MKEKGIFNLKLIEEKLVGNFTNENHANIFYPEGAKSLHGLNPADPFIGSFETDWPEASERYTAILKINKNGFIYKLTWINPSRLTHFQGTAQRVGDTLYGCYWSEYPV